MAEERAVFEKAVKVIGGHKAQITIASDRLQQVVERGEVTVEEISAVKAAKTMVEKQMQKIEAQSDALLGNEHYNEAALREVTNYLLDRANLCEMVSTIINKFPGGNNTQNATLDTSGLGAALSESLANLSIRQPLHASDLPSFNGDPSEFVPFIEAFDFLVNTDGIPDAMKAMYLKRCIKERGVDGRPNPAHDLVKHITPNAQNYKLMRDKLEKSLNCLI